MTLARQIRRRNRLFKQHPFCHWCGQRLVNVTGPRVKHFPPNAATLDHRHGRLDPRRRTDYSPNNWSVLACWQCNHERGQDDEKKAGIDEMRRRAGRFPGPVPVPVAEAK